MVSEKQKELDQIKWDDSQKAGADTCGEYEFCKYCKKEEENPCANALRRSKKNSAKRAKNKAKINGKEFRATVVNKD